MTSLLAVFEDIDKQGPDPLYQQIKQTIQHKIVNGDWAAGQKLPSENELVTAMAVSRMTINRALRELTQEKLITRVHGLGSFVAEKPRHASLIELQDIALEIEGNGKKHSSKVLGLETVLAKPKLAKAMQIKTGTSIYHLNAVHYQDGLPIQLESRFVIPAQVPDFIDQDFSQQTSTAYLLKQLQPDEMEHIVRAILPDKKASKHLHIESNSPCLQLERRTWTNQKLITFVTLTYPGASYDLGARYATDQYRLS